MRAFVVTSLLLFAPACSSPDHLRSQESPPDAARIDDAIAAALRSASEAELRGIERMLRLAPEVRAEREAALAAALEAHDANRNEETAIWVGRRLAYLGLHEAAVGWYTRRLGEDPTSYKLLRHLGHRQITLRAPEAAIATLERARELTAGRADDVEPDGMPNAAGIPTSTTFGNIDYHLALAYYLSGRLEEAATAWRRCVEQHARNDDSRVAAGHWLCLTLRRLGRERGLAATLATLPEAPEVIENFAYRDLLDLQAGRKRLEDVVGTAADAVQDATRAYGIARWLIDREDATSTERDRGRAWLRALATTGPFESFGRIAAEFDAAQPGTPRDP